MNASTVVYLDHAATTPMRPEAFLAMQPFYTERFGNPSGSHRVARDARRALDEARDVVAACLGARPGEVVFTGGGTEADNAAIVGTIERQGGHPVCPAAEHHAVLHVVERAKGRVLPVDSSARVDLTALADALTPEVSVVSVMAVNNEVGAITPLGAVAALVRQRAPRAVVHTDAVQAATWMDLGELTQVVDLVSLSAHKFGGPKGVGVLWVREGVTLAPMLAGGGQERDRRSGTHNVAGIVAMAEALRLTHEHRDADVARIRCLRDRLVDEIVTRVPDVWETVPRDHKVAGSAHLCVAGVDSESLLFLADQGGVCASAASACSSGAMEPSHVLAAMRVDRTWASGALRLSLGTSTSAADVDRAIDVLVDVIGRLRRGRTP
jgi:cysteine desulfurase